MMSREAEYIRDPNESPRTEKYLKKYPTKWDDGKLDTAEETEVRRNNGNQN